MADIKSALKNFANKITGISVVDNEANPASAASIMKRSIASQAKGSPKPFKFANKQNTFGVPNAK